MAGNGGGEMARADNATAALFGCNSYAYMLSLGAEDCLAKMADLGFREFELMVHPGHLWPAELSADKRRTIRRMLAQHGLQLTTLNLPNIDINIASTTPEMRAYSLDRLTETVRLAGELGVRGVVMSPGKPSALLPAEHEVLTGYFFAALDRLGPIARASGTALWIENVTVSFLPRIGGIMEAKDAIEFLIAGASAVQVGTANFLDPRAGITIAAGIAAWCEEQGISDVGTLVGSLDAGQRVSVLDSWL